MSSSWACPRWHGVSGWRQGRCGGAAFPPETSHFLLSYDIILICILVLLFSKQNEDIKRVSSCYRVFKLTTPIEHMTHNLTTLDTNSKSSLKEKFAFLIYEKYQRAPFECVCMLLHTHIRKSQWRLASVLLFICVLLVCFFRCVIFLLIYRITLAFSLVVGILHASPLSVLTSALHRGSSRSRCWTLI